MNADQVVTLVTSGILLVGTLSGSVLLYCANVRTIRSAERSGTRERHEGLLREAYSELYASLVAWRDAVNGAGDYLKSGGEVTNLTTELQRIKAQAERHAILWSPTMAQLVREYRKIMTSFANLIPSKKLSDEDARHRWLEDCIRQMALSNADTRRKMQKAEKLLEDVRRTARAEIIE